MQTVREGLGENAKVLRLRKIGVNG